MVNCFLHLEQTRFLESKIPVSMLLQIGQVGGIKSADRFHSWASREVNPWLLNLADIRPLNISLHILSKTSDGRNFMICLKVFSVIGPFTMLHLWQTIARFSMLLSPHLSSGCLCSKLNIL